MRLIRTVTIDFEEDVINDIFKNIYFENFYTVDNPHITIVYMTDDDTYRDTKIEVIDYCKSLIRAGTTIFKIKFDGIYQGNNDGNIFAKVLSITPNLPLVGNQIFHLTKYVNYLKDFKPVDSLIALQNNQYTKIKDIDPNIEYIGNISYKII